MSWKIPVKYKQRDMDAALSPNIYKVKRHLNDSHIDKQTRERLPHRPVVIKLKAREAKKYQPCPRHGTKFLVREGGSIYCFAETKGEIFDRCFYHVCFKDNEEEMADDSV